MSALEEKKVEIEKLLQEFEWHLTRLDEITREASQKMGGFAAFCKEHGHEDGIVVAIALFDRLKAIAMKFQTLKAGVIAENSRVV
jgi:hypothetical protein